MDVHALNMYGKASQEITVGAKLLEWLLKRTKRSAGLHMRSRCSAGGAGSPIERATGRFKPVRGSETSAPRQTAKQACVETEHRQRSLACTLRQTCESRRMADALHQETNWRDAQQPDGEPSVQVDVTRASVQVAAGPLTPDMSEFGVPEQVHPVSAWVLWTCGFVALAGLGPAAMSFYFLWHPFGTNPPPREVMMIGGAAFVLMSAVLAGMALRVRTLTYLVFPQALVEMRGVRSRIFRWDDITELFEEPRGTTRFRIVVGG